MNKEDLIPLVLAAQAGDRHAFGQLVEAYQGAVMAIANRRLGNFALAQELAQDVFIHALRKLEQLKQPECFGGWLRSIANRMAINQALRHREPYSTEQEVLEASCVERQTPVDRAMENERARQLKAGLKKLRSMDREALEAFYLNGDSIDEMSNKFESPVGTIKRRLHMARKRLAEQLAELAV